MNTKDKTIIITGGLGFIGSNLIAALEKKGFNNIVVVDYFGCDEKWRNVANRSNIIKYINPNNLFRELEHLRQPILSVIHLGGISSTTEKDVDLIIKTNFDLSFQLYCWCKSHKISFVYASSAAVYGNARAFTDSQSSKDIESLKPLNAYGWSKKILDAKIARDNGFSNGVNQVVGLRFFNVYGPNEYHKGNQSSVIFHFYYQLIADGEIKLFKSTDPSIQDGEQKRDFVYVEDCISVIIWMIEHPDVSGLFNVGTGVARSYNDVANIVRTTSSKKNKINYIEMPNNLISQYQNFTQAELDKLRKVGYDGAFKSIEEGIKAYINILKQREHYI